MVIVSRFKHIIANAYNYKEALDRENIKQTNVNLLREKVKSSEFVPKFVTDKQLLLFLNAGKNDVDNSSKLIHNYYKIKKSTPKFFANRDVASKEIQDCLDNQVYVRLPLTQDNCYLIFHRLSNYDPKYYNFDSAAKTFIMLTESDFYHQGPRSGIVFLFDLTGVGIRHLFKPSISSMRKGIKFLEEGMPCEIKAVHILNAGFIFEKILAIVKPFVGYEMLSKVVLHPTKLDYEKFHRECIPKKCLPKNYGGSLPSVEKLHDLQRKTFSNLRDYFLYEEKQSNFHFDEHAADFNDS